ncbi:hypothetical protein [uncultured Desulfovibrio sp.]|uniref:hypothetical protein n=1 Tax=uncultured Desulfovibrio sp. TaxID=167968 RepID=UPI0027296E2F|nr:hypothetical protein [uncultured Desulfovibrio sp.]
MFVILLPQIPLGYFPGLGVDLVLLAVLRRAPFGGVFSQRGIGHHHIRPGPAFFHQRHMVAPNVAHDEVVLHALVLARRKVRLITIGAGKLPE